MGFTLPERADARHCRDLIRRDHLNTVNGDVNFVRVAPGETVLLELPHSEVCMHMGVAGSIREVELARECRSGLAMAQILDHDGRPCGAPVAPGEAGIFSDRNGFYAYVSLEEPTNQPGNEAGRLHGRE